MKNEIRYEVQFCNYGLDDWHVLSKNIESKKKAKDIVRDCKAFGVEFKYRILKLTIKKEIVK